MSAVACATRNYFLVGYGVAAFAQVLFAATKVIFVQLAGLRASRLLHERMLSRVLGAPMSFFDITPTGKSGARELLESNHPARMIFADIYGAPQEELSIDLVQIWRRQTISWPTTLCAADLLVIES
eukprot:SAG11_NODE_274_length_11310_cov_4.717510_8_plen_126_part_00